jgi:hypothetical protein
MVLHTVGDASLISGLTYHLMAQVHGLREVVILGFGQDVFDFLDHELRRKQTQQIGGD